MKYFFHLCNAYLVEFHYNKILKCRDSLIQTVLCVYFVRTTFYTESSVLPMLVSPSVSQVVTLTPKAVVLGGGSAFLNGISALVENSLGEIPFAFCHVRCSDKVAVCEPETQSLPAPQWRTSQSPNLGNRGALPAAAAMD